MHSSKFEEKHISMLRILSTSIKDKAVLQRVLAENNLIERCISILKMFPEISILSAEALAVVTEAIKSSDDTIIKNLIDTHIPSILDCLILSEEKNPYSLSLELALINIPHYKQILEGNENWKQKKNALTAVLEEKKTKEESEKQAKRLLIEEIDKELEDLQKKNKPLENRNTEKLVETLTNEVKQLEINTQKLKQKKEENEIWQVKGPKKENINTKKTRSAALSS